LVDVAGARGSLALFWMWALAEQTFFTRDDRAFIARSLPWWLEESGADLNWDDDLVLSIAEGGDELRRVLTITNIASKRAGTVVDVRNDAAGNVTLTRQADADDGLDQATP
jgi:hypothetical protein